MMHESMGYSSSFISFRSVLMRRSLVLFAVLAAGCSAAYDHAPSADLPPDAVAQDGSAAEGTLIALRVPHMV